MTLFLDSANPNEIMQVLEWGVISGVTTNQKIFLKGGRKYSRYKETIKQICNLVCSPVSVELTKTHLTTTDMINEAKFLRKISQWINIKVPMWGDGRGLFIINRLTEDDIPTNATCMMVANQGILAAEAGAKYVSLFYNRIIDHNHDRLAGIREISSLKDYLSSHGLESKIIAGSIRHPLDIMECFQAGADIVTVTLDVLKRMIPHPRTESTIKEFDAAWKEFKKGLNRISIFDWQVSILSINLHGFTVLILLVLGLITMIKTRKHHEWALVFGTAAVTISIHLYEATHAFCQLITTGSTGPVEINIVSLFGALLFIVMINRNLHMLGSIKIMAIAFSLFILSMIALTFSGHFTDYPHNIVFGPLWGLTKIAVCVATLSLFWRKEYA